MIIVAYPTLLEFNLFLFTALKKLTQYCGSWIQYYYTCEP